MSALIEIPKDGIGAVRVVLAPSPDIRKVVGEHGELIVVGHCVTTPAEFAAAAAHALRSGDDAILHALPGCFSSVLVRGGHITARTDPVGQFPLFLTEAADRHLLTDRAETTATGVDRLAVAARLVCPEACDLIGLTTPFAGVRRLPAGHVWRAAAGHAALTARDLIEPVPGRRLEDAAEELRAALLAAVRARTALGQVTADFSGGIDSVSLAFLAAAEVDELPVLTFRNTLAPVEDDFARARRYARLHPALRHREVVGGEADLPYQRLDSDGGEPHPAALVTGPLRARMAAVAGPGGTHLMGEGGDVVLSAPAAYLADLARGGDLAELWRHCLAWGRLRTAAPAALFRAAVVAAARGDGLRTLADALERPPRREPGWAARWTSPWSAAGAPWLRRAVAGDLAARLREPVVTAAGGGLADLVTSGALRLQNLTQRTLRGVGHEFGVAVHAPFLDSAVVRACLALSGADRVRPSAPKPLLATALAGIVPVAVLNRTTKGDYTSSAHVGARRAAARLRGLIADDCAAADHGLLEPGRVRPVLEDALRGLPVPWGALNQVFAVELWLRATGKVVR